MKKSYNQAADQPAAAPGLLADAMNVDGAVSRDERQSALDQAMLPEAPAGETVSGPAAAPETSALKETFCVLLQLTITRLHVAWDWSDPGEKWREEVGNSLGLLADRYIGQLAANHTLELSLVFMIAPWIIENAITKGFPKGAAAEPGADVNNTSPGSARSDRVREVNTSSPAAEPFRSSVSPAARS